MIWINSKTRTNKESIDKESIDKNTWYDWYDWLINYTFKPIKKLWVVF